MRVLQILTQMEAAGAQRVAYLIHEGFVARGHESHLSFLYIKRPAYSGVPGVSAVLDHPPARTEYLGIISRLTSMIRQRRPDAVITHTHYANVVGQAAACVAGVSRRVAVHHGPLSTYPMLAKAADAVLGSIGAYSQMVAVSDAVVATTRRYPRSYRRLVTRIHNGLPEPAKADIRDVREKWKIPADAQALVHVGRMSREKNHSTLLRAVCMLADVHVVLVGDGELRDSIREEIRALGLERRVHMTGEIPSSEVVSLLRTATAFVFPSLWESMGLAALEALQVGLPVVASDIPALRELLGDAGVLVSPRDAAGLAAALRSVLDDPALRERLRGRAVARAKLYSVDRMVDAYEEVIGAR